MLNISRFLWVAFQIDSICSQDTDAAILTALEDLPRDLPDTFNRILRRLQKSNIANPNLCKKVFDLVAAAQRPLTLEELREAVSVVPGETAWDASKLVNNMLKSLLDSCGSLVAVDEEHLTVHFAHHSVKQHLLSHHTDSDTKKYHINMQAADLYLGNIIVTYLNFEIFDQQLTKVTATTLPQVTNYPSAILESLPRSSFANRVAVRLLKSRRDSSFDVHSQLKTAAGIGNGRKEQTQSAQFFLPYAQEYWLFHTKFFKYGEIADYSLWQRLTDGKVNTVKLPSGWIQQSNGKMQMLKRMKWIIQNKHWALIDQSLDQIVICRDQRHDEAAKLLLEFLEGSTETSVSNVNFVAALYLASYLNNKAVVLLSLRNEADINASCGYYGNALQAASITGHEEITGLLLKNGANINAEGGYYGNALQAAPTGGHEGITRLLLKNGANVNAEGGYYGNALQAASIKNREEVARLLLKNGANVNAKGGFYGHALQAASAYGHAKMTRFLLENGADVNAEGGEYGNALQVASANGYLESTTLLLENGANIHKKGKNSETPLEAASKIGAEAIVRLLLDKGAIGNDKTMRAALEWDNGSQEVEKMIRDASKPHC